jgi:hypothetical protein
MGGKWSTASGKSGTISEEPIDLAAGEAGEWFEHNFENGGWRIHLPPQARVKWPVLPHNQYVKDGKAKTEEGRIVITLPFDKDLLIQEVSVEVP